MVWSKIKESLISVLPIAAIVVILSLTVAPMQGGEILSFLVGCVFVIGGMSLFAIGADVAMIPIGELVGSATTKTRNLTVILVVSLLIGTVITLAEPDLTVLASGLAASINKWVLISLVALGVGDEHAPPRNAPKLRRQRGAKLAVADDEQGLARQPLNARVEQRVVRKHGAAARERQGSRNKYRFIFTACDGAAVQVEDDIGAF